MMYICGIDPGFTGGVAFIATHEKYGRCHRMPLQKIKTSARSKRKIDGEELAGIMEHYKPCHAVIENVHSFPGQGIAGMFAFGRGFGALEGILESLEVPISYVSPIVWKRYYGLIKMDKDASRILAEKKFGMEFKKVESGMAEAMLIAQWKLETWWLKKDDTSR